MLVYDSLRLSEKMGRNTHEELLHVKGAGMIKADIKQILNFEKDLCGDTDIVHIAAHFLCSLFMPC